MTERFLPRLSYAVARPFVKTGKAVRRASGDILEGGRIKREDANHGYPVKRSRVRDALRAVSPVALFGGSAGFFLPFVGQITQEVIADTTTTVPYPGDPNWSLSIWGAGIGLVGGIILNAEHSRRIGRDSRG